MAKSPTERAIRTDNGCLVYAGSLNDDGYGVVFLGRYTDDNGIRRQRYGRAHRVADEERHGPIPDGIVVEHACCTADLSCDGGPSCPHRACMEETHLVRVTHARNLELAVEKRRLQREATRP